MEVRIKPRGGLVEFAAESRGKTVLTSAPVGVGGADDAMMPTELLMASLGTCVAYYAAQYLKKFQLSAEGLAVRVKADTLKNPGRLDNFRIEVDAPGAPPEHRAALEEAVMHCTVHNTLTHPPSMNLQLNVGG